MNRKFFLSITLLISCLVLLSCNEKKKYNLPVQTLVITNDGSEKSVNVKAELAIKADERNYGFMNRKNIPDGTGMLFVFEKDQVLSFWMKNTPHPLSIAYIDSAGTIADILDMTPFSETSITSSRSVRYALEVPQGWFKKNGVGVGDKVKWLNENQISELRTIK